MSAAAAGAGRAIQKLPKPNMKNHFRDYLVKTFYYGLPGSTALTMICYVLYVQRRAKVYDEYFGKMTPEKEMEDFERMRQLGVFQSVPPDGVERKKFVD